MFRRGLCGTPNGRKGMDSSMTEAVCREKSCYLRSDTNLELLAFRWYAWPHLVAPLQHAMNMAFRHVPLLESYLANPQIHAVTVQDPSMLGAPFVDIPPPQSAQAR